MDRLKLFVGGLSRETSDLALKEHFSKYGEVAGCIVAQDRETGERRGFGFVTFSDPNAFDRALKDCHVILQRRVDVKKAIPKCEQLRNIHYSNGLSRNSTRSNDHKASDNSQCSTKKIFVGGLSPSVSENEFKSYFEQFGKITDVVVMHDSMTHRPRGFGFITFETVESVENVTRKCYHEIGGKVAEVKRAVPKDGVNGGGHSSRVENGIVSYTNHQNGNYITYPDAYSSSLPIYGETIGYYGPPTLYGPGFPIGGFYGVSYEVANVEPASPMMFPSPLIGYSGSPMPSFGNVSAFYPTYLNGGVGVLGTPNSTVMCNGFANSGVYKGFTEFGNGDGQVAANVSSVQITEMESNGVSMNGGLGR